jgi:hypothetical protein
VKAHLRSSPVAMIAILTGILSAQPPAPVDKIVVPEGTDIKMKTLEALSSKTAKVGDPVALEVTQDVRINGKVVVPRGSKAHGEVTLVKKSGIAGKAGDLAIRPNYVRVGDLKIVVRGSKDTEGASKRGEAIALASISGVGILKRGQTAQVPVGTEVIGIVTEDTSVSATGLATSTPAISGVPSPASKK